MFRYSRIRRSSLAVLAFLFALFAICSPMFGQKAEKPASTSASANKRTAASQPAIKAVAPAAAKAPAKTPAKAAVPAGQSGMIAVVDPATGQLRPATDADINGLTTTGAVDITPSQTIDTGNGVKLIPSPALTIYSTATVGPDGKLVMGETKGPAETNKAIKQNGETRRSTNAK